MIETSASKSEAILNARCNSPFILFLLHLLGIREFQKAGNFPGFQNIFVVMEPSEFTLKAVLCQEILLGWNIRLIFCFYDGSSYSQIIHH